MNFTERRDTLALKLMYITNDTAVAKIAEDNGVDRIFMDMEYIGKEARQPGDTVKSHHTVDDVKKIRSVITKSELMVRVNPLTPKNEGFIGSAAEIDAVIDAGADVIMLPMAKSAAEIREFVKLVGGRARTMLLLETREAMENLDEILSVGGIDEVHIGLNDLHLSLGEHFMFEPLADGTVDMIAEKIAERGLPYGFGGIARIGYGMLPAEYVIKEHYRLGSTFAILSRSFCNIGSITDEGEIRKIFSRGVKSIRDFERSLSGLTPSDFEQNRREVARLVNEIVGQVR